MILFALITVFDVVVSVLLIAFPARVNDVLDAIRQRVLGRDRGVVVSDGLLRALGLFGLLLSSIFIGLTVAWLINL